MSDTPMLHSRLPGASSLPAQEVMDASQVTPPTDTTSLFSPVASAEYEAALAWEAGVAAVIP